MSKYFPCQCAIPISLYSENIGPFTSNASLTISATLSSLPQINFFTLGIIGSANDCNGQPLQSGFAIITNGSYYTYANVINGQYSGSLSGCGTVNSINVRVFDNNSSASSAFSSYPFNGNTIAVPPITLTCPFSGLNIYDGVYSVEAGHVQRYISPGVPEVGILNGDLLGNPDVYLVTVEPNSVTIPASPGPGQLLWAAGSNSSIAGIDPLRIEVDGNNNVTISSPIMVPNLGNWAGHPNTYDPATKTFHLSFTWTNTAGAPREYEIVLKYKQPRP